MIVLEVSRCMALIHWFRYVFTCRRRLFQGRGKPTPWMLKPITRQVCTFEWQDLTKLWLASLSFPRCDVPGNLSELFRLWDFIISFWKAVVVKLRGKMIKGWWGELERKENVLKSEIGDGHVINPNKSWNSRMIYFCRVEKLIHYCSRDENSSTVMMETALL